MENYKHFSNEYCDYLIDYFSKEQMEAFENFNRKYSRLVIYKEDLLYSFLWSKVDNLIKQNLGDTHYLSKWVIVLKYIKGDYFLPHTDLPSNLVNTDDRYLSGGVELSNKEDFTGGNYTIPGKTKKYNRGNLLTHNTNVIHEVSMVESGVRWSLHFGINDTELKKILI